MSRTITLLRVTLLLRTAGGVSAPETDHAIDLPLARGPKHLGHAPHVPPSSLAGALRSHLGADADRFLGPPPGTENLVPSPVRLLGSDVTLPDGGATQLVRSTAIDSDRGAARTGTLRTREFLPAGTTVVCYLRADDPVPAAELAELLRRWTPVIGRGRTTGFGRTSITQIATRSLDLTTRDGLTAWLSGDLYPDGDDAYQVLTGVSADAAPALQLTFRIVDALAVGDGERNKPATIYREDGIPAVPGTAWKGVLRSRCAYILRSCGATVCTEAQPCRTCPICRLFGFTLRGAAPGEATGSAGMLEFTTTPIANATVSVRNHVAIDRFTGGARNGLLYAHEAVTTGHLTLTVYSPTPMSAADRGLLLLAVRDLHDGLIGLGGATTRGFGTLRLDEESAAALDELDAGQVAGKAVRELLTDGAA